MIHNITPLPHPRAREWVQNLDPKINHFLLYKGFGVYGYVHAG